MGTEVLDRMLEQIDKEEGLSSIVLVKGLDAYHSIPRDAAEYRFGSLKEVGGHRFQSKAGVVDIPLFEEERTPERIAAQQQRAEEFHIDVKDGYGSLDIPSGWKQKGLDVADFADPVHFIGPLHDKEATSRVLAAWEEKLAPRYSDAERQIIKGRLDEAVKKFGIADVPAPTQQNSEPRRTDSEGSSPKDVQFEGESFQQFEVKDRLGRTTYRFTHGETPDETTPYTFVHRGSIATLEVPKNTTHEDVQRLLGILAMQKSATGRGHVHAKQGTFEDALQDAAEGLACSALSAGWWAFCSMVMDYWGGELEDIDEVTYDNYVDTLSSYLKGAWRKYGNVDDVMQSAAEALRIMKIGLKNKTDKAGRSLSRASQDKIESAITTLSELLPKADETDDGDKTVGGNQSRSKSLGSDTTDTAQLRAELLKAVKADVGAELAGVKADLQKRAGEADVLRQQLEDANRKLADLGRQPLHDDPLGDYNPEASGQKQKAATSGSSVYDYVT